jgi:hypothetical protein
MNRDEKWQLHMNINSVDGADISFIAAFIDLLSSCGPSQELSSLVIDYSLLRSKSFRVIKSPVRADHYLIMVASKTERLSLYEEP